MNIIGISMGYHDSACCLLQNGALVAAIEEERFSRSKNDKGTPQRAFRYCLEHSGLRIGDIDCVAFYENPRDKLARQIWAAIQDPGAGAYRTAVLENLLHESPLEAIRTTLGYEGPIEVVDHHLSHAGSCYLFSQFETAAIMTVDGVGDWPTTTYCSGSGPNIQRLESVDYPHSLGLFYSTLTGYLGFEVNEGEYKMMGLAAYGKPRFMDALRQLVHSGPAGQYHLDLKYFNFLQTTCMYTPHLLELLGKPPRQPNEPIEQFHMDLASSAQQVLEEVLLEKIRYLHTRVPTEALCMAGGVALNVVANSRCLREGPFKHLFVQPAAGDAGGAVGAAAVAQVRLTGCRPVRPLRNAYLGPRNEPDAVYRLLQGTSAVFADYRGRESALLSAAAGYLVDGKVVGWCQGRCEFGPRALGNRSILADPRRPEMRDRINASVKMRETFRPFAPSVLEHEQANHFALHHPSPFMLETAQVISPIDLPAITHVDGTARIHTVNEQENPRFARLLQQFLGQTGCPVLLNTSFNLRGEPIVLSAFDAISCFIRSTIDVLVIEDFVIERQGIPASWELLTQHRARRGSVEHLVYSFL